MFSNLIKELDEFNIFVFLNDMYVYCNKWIKMNKFNIYYF